MVEETPSRMPVGAYRILNDGDDEEAAMQMISPVLLSKSNNNITFDDDSRFRNRSQPITDDDDDSEYIHFTFSQESELNGLNFLNLVTLTLQLIVTYGIGIWGLDGYVLTFWDVNKNYETLVTPADWMYWSWIPILVFESVFSIAQVLPSFRSRTILQDGTGYFFFYACLLQTAYTMCFSFHVFIASFILAVATCLTLSSLLLRQHYSQLRRSKTEYWIFRLPFLLHLGWMVVMVVVNASMMCRNIHSSSIATQLTVDVVGLSILLPLAIILLWFSSVKDFVIPFIIMCYYVRIVVCS